LSLLTDISLSARCTLSFLLQQVTVGCEAFDGTDCTDIPPGTEGNCLVDIEYCYELVNVGETDMTITKLERTCQGDTADLIGLVDSTNLVPGQTTIVCEEKVLDTCVETCYETTVEVEADPPAGVPCLGIDTYEYSIVPSEVCEVEVSITAIRCIFTHD